MRIELPDVSASFSVIFVTISSLFISFNCFFKTGQDMLNPLDLKHSHIFLSLLLQYLNRGIFSSYNVARIFQSHPINFDTKCKSSNEAVQS